MEVKYTAHAVQRMIEREISPREVESLLKKPDGTIRQSKDKTIAYKRFESRKDNLIAVVAVERGEHQEVITVLVNFEVPR